jgi:disulfide bond formation protein DsbB
MFKKKIKWHGLVLSFAIPALLLGAFHSLLQWGIISESITECSTRSAVSCADPEIMWLGFITIPFLGLLTNAAIIIVTLMSDKKSKLSKWATKILS